MEKIKDVTEVQYNDLIARTSKTTGENGTKVSEIVEAFSAEVNKAIIEETKNQISEDKSVFKIQAELPCALLVTEINADKQTATFRYLPVTKHADQLIEILGEAKVTREKGTAKAA